MKLTGKVRSGVGNFSYWMARLEPFYTARTGVKLFPGTLNIELDQPFDLPEKAVIRLEKEEYGGMVSVSILPCRFFDRHAFILRTDNNAANQGPHPTTIIEVACEVKLRDTFNLHDGDIVSVDIEI